MSEPRAAYIAKEREPKATVYVAGPLFTERQRIHNISVAESLYNAGYDVYVPQVDTGLAEYNEKGDCIVSVKQKDLVGLISCDYVLASIWDGFIDEGTCYEIGYAQAKDIPVVILSDDHRPMRNEMFSAIPKYGTTAECIAYLNTFPRRRKTEKIGDKVLVLCSGGLDSTVLLYTAVELYGKENVYISSMSYGQRHVKELECIQYHAYKIWGDDALDHAGIADLAEVFALSQSTNPLLANKAVMPTGTYEEQGSVPATYVPFRNGLFLSYATAIAYQLGCDAIAYGAHADDAAGAAYPDCTNLFIERMGQAIEAGTAGRVKLWAPWKFMTKTAVVRQGIEIGMTQDDFDHTWSCYEGGEKPCGKCATCLDRIAAFDGTGFRP